VVARKEIIRKKLDAGTSAVINNDEHERLEPHVNFILLGGGKIFHLSNGLHRGCISFGHPLEALLGNPED
jgi:hypothetical protein